MVISTAAASMPPLLSFFLLIICGGGGSGSSSSSRLLLILMMMMMIPWACTAVSFNFSSFSPNSNPNITFHGDASASVDYVIELTRNQVDTNLKQSRGWAVYSQPVRLWDNATGNLADFASIFSFFVRSVSGQNHGDGLAFFLAPYGTTMPNGTRGGTLALFGDGSADGTGFPATGPVVAVEFDTFKNFWDQPGVHIGIDVGSIVSVANVSWAPFGEWGNASMDARITYDSRTMELSARFSGGDGRNRSLIHVVDLRRVLPERVTIGFSATTGSYIEIHRILSWSFSSSLEVRDQPAPEAPSSPPDHPPKVTTRNIGLVAGFGCLAVVLGGALLWLIISWRRKATSSRWRGEGSASAGEEMIAIDDSEIEQGRVSRRFTYRELARATGNFAPDRKLGRGGFGDVYKGFLRDMGLEVAVKKVARDSTQGKKEYLSEINIIGRLRHRHLVRLVGWCHDRGELLLVYEYLPNGSLDAQLFGSCSGMKGPSTVIAWPMRYKIAQGLASALLYLHEGWDQCVVHRDVKSSNVMLDADFNPKLGDFGLARLVHHGLSMQTTMPAGTWGYLAPECATSGKASKESDVYSFGVVALEITCGRKSFDPAAGEGKLMLVGWVWGLYELGQQQSLLGAADERLRSDFDEAEMERLMVVGLWCAQPDLSLRPSMRQVVAALNFEVSPPLLTYTPPTFASFSQLQLPLSSSSGTGAGSSSTAASSVVTASSVSAAGSDHIAAGGVRRLSNARLPIDRCGSDDH